MGTMKINSEFEVELILWDYVELLIEGDSNIIICNKRKGSEIYPGYIYLVGGIIQNLCPWDLNTDFLRLFMIINWDEVHAILNNIIRIRNVWRIDKLGRQIESYW